MVIDAWIENSKFETTTFDKYGTIIIVMISRLIAVHTLRLDTNLH